MTESRAERIEKETGRLEAFSDGVFAVALTLLVLDLKVPSANFMSEPGDLLQALWREWPTFAAYLSSFGTILVIWMNHHNLFTYYIKRVNNAFMVLNGVMLLLVTLNPFSTSMFAPHYGAVSEKIAALIYAGAYFLMAVAFNVLWIYASVGHRLVDKHVTKEQIEAVRRQYIVGPAAYACAMIVAFFSASLCFLIVAGVMLFFAVTASMSPDLCERQA